MLILQVCSAFGMSDVIENLFYRNIIKRLGLASKRYKRRVYIKMVYEKIVHMPTRILDDFITSRLDALSAKSHFEN